MHLERPVGKGRPVDLLVEGFRKGTPGAFEAIVRAHQDRVYSFCARMLSDREDALDAAQEVFLSAWRNLAEFRGEAALSTWLLRIAANRCLNRIRRRKSLSEREAPWPEPFGEPDEGIDFQPAGGEADHPDRLAETREMGEVVKEALSRLDPVCRWRCPLGRRGILVPGGRRPRGCAGGYREVQAAPRADGDARLLSPVA